MQTVVFLVNTEYHLLLSLGIICQYFPNHHVVVYRGAPAGGKRLKSVDFKNTDIEYHELISDYVHPNKKIWTTLDEIINLQPECFFFFNEYAKYWSNYLLSNLHKKGTKIILGPDGMKVYGPGNRPMSWNIIIKNAARTFLFAVRSRVPLTKAGPYFRRNYASSKYIDEVWVEYPESYTNRSQKKVVEFHLPSSDNQNYLDLLNAVFMVDLPDMMPLKDKTILFLDSPIKSNAYLNKSTEILKTVQHKYPERKLLIKLHQLSASDVMETYKTLDNVSFIESRYPAELYIANASDAIVLSLVSTSLLYYNPNCSYYWTYPLFEEYKSVINNPTKHIKVITDCSQI